MLKNITLITLVLCFGISCTKKKAEETTEPSSGSDPVSATPTPTATPSVTVPSGLSYANNAAYYIQNVAITPNTPSLSAGSVTSYSVSPSLPTGLSLNTSTGIITGTPTTIQSSANYTITGTGSSGSTTKTLTIAVTNGSPSFSYARNPADDPLNNSCTDNTVVLTGPAIDTFAVHNDTPLPSGYSLNTSTGTISGYASSEVRNWTTMGAEQFQIIGTNAYGSITVTVGILAYDKDPIGITLSPTAYSFVRNSAITAIRPKPTACGGPMNSWSVNPTLPSGLSLNSSTGEITGTPTNITAQATYTISASKNGLIGDTVFTKTLSLTITGTAPSNLTYGTNPASYPVGAAISSNNPSSSGDAVSSYSVSPALPAGLTLNTTTGVISGTPSAITAQATYVVTATNSSGSTSANLVLTIPNAAPTNLNYSYSSATFSVGTIISNNSPSNSGGPVSSYSVSPPLPSGLGLDTSTGVISGTPTQISASGTYTVTATNAVGSTTKNLTFSVIEASNRFLYTSDYSEHRILIHSMNRETGILTYVNQVVSAEDSTNDLARGVVVHPSGKFVYYVCPSFIKSYDASPTTGLLSNPQALTGSLSGRSSLAFDPSGRFAYSGSNTTVSAYTVNATSGAFTSAGTGAVPGTANSVVVHPTGRYVYALSSGSPAYVYIFSVNQTTGALTSITNISTGQNLAEQLVIAQNGKFLMSRNTSSIAVFSISATDGTLTLNSNPSIGSTSMSMHPTGRFLLLISGGNIASYTVNQSDGALNSASSASTGITTTRSLTIDPSGRFAFPVGYSTGPGYVSAIGIDPNSGAVSAGSAIADGWSPNGAASSNGPVRYAYVVNSGADTLSQFSVSSSGTLSSLSTANISTGANPTQVAQTPSGKFIYVANSNSGGNGSISAYSQDSSNGQLSIINTYSPGSPVSSVGVDPSGKYLFVAGGSTVYSYSIHQTTGALTSVTSLGGGSSFSNLVFSQNGKYFYLTSGTSISWYTIDLSNGQFSYGGNYSLAYAPTALEMSKNGLFLFSASNEYLTSLSVQLDDGQLSNPNNVSTGTNFGSKGIMTSLDGSFVYVANQTDQSISGFALNHSSGVLTSLGSATAIGGSPDTLKLSADGTTGFVSLSNGNLKKVSINPSSGAVTTGSSTASGTNPQGFLLSH